MAGRKVGIDLGTTYSVVSYVDDLGVIQNIESKEGEKTTPSVVYFAPDNSKVVVGSRARDEGAMDPENIVERVKNFMGDPDFKIEKNGQMYSPCAVSTIILKKLIEDAENWLQSRGDEIEGAVITCPAYFGDAAREATRMAGENVKLSNGQPLKVLKIMDEPTAAAIAYGNSHSEDMHKTVLIYDLGGGTFDCTVMRLDFDGQDRKYKVITTGGNHQLGGKDWDDLLADYVKNEFCTASGVDRSELDDDPDMKAWFSENMEKNKQRLTSMPSVNITVSYGGNKQKIEVTLEKFNEITAGKFNETTMLIDDMLAKKGMTMDEIDEIILVGGSTRMLQVVEGLKVYYNKPLVSFDPDKAVSNGAALVASGMNVDSNFGGEEENTESSAVDGNASLEGGTSFEGPGGTNNVVEELCTKSYCLRTYENEKPIYCNLIKKDTPKPATGSTKQIYNRLAIGGQGDDKGMTDSIKLVILENESLEDKVTIDECQELYEEMPISFEPPVSVKAAVEVLLQVDINGQLTLTLVEQDTGIKHEVHPVRKGGDSNSLGMDIASTVTLA